MECSKCANAGTAFNVEILRNSEHNWWSNCQQKFSSDNRKNSAVITVCLHQYKSYGAAVCPSTKKIRVSTSIAHFTIRTCHSLGATQEQARLLHLSAVFLAVALVVFAFSLALVITESLERGNFNACLNWIITAMNHCY